MDQIEKQDYASLKEMYGPTIDTIFGFNNNRQIHIKGFKFGTEARDRIALVRGTQIGNKISCYKVVVLDKVQGKLPKTTIYDFPYGWCKAYTTLLFAEALKGTPQETLSQLVEDLNANGHPTIDKFPHRFKVSNTM